MRQILKFRFMDVIWNGCGAKNLALLQNQCKSSQLGKLINLINGKMAHKGKNYSIKLQKYYFCTTTRKRIESHSYLQNFWYTV